MRYLATILRCGILVGCLSWQPATTLAQERRPVQVDVDHAAFAYDDRHALMEVYLAFAARDLTYQRAEAGYSARLPVDLALLHSTLPGLPAAPEAPVWQDSLTLQFVVPDTSALLTGQRFVHQLRTAVPPGEYTLRVIIPGDPARQRAELTLQRDVFIPDFSNPGLVGLSDLTLATAIEPSRDRENPFYKNGLVIRPNANQLFGSNLRRLFYYGEVYNLPAVLGDDASYTVLAYIAEANLPQPLPDYQQRTQRPVRHPDVLAGSFDISRLPSGSYFLRIALLNEANEALAEQARKFFVYNPGVERAGPTLVETDFENSQYAAMSEEEVSRAFAHIDLIATEQERRRMKGLRTLEARQRFLMEFWDKRDPNPNTTVNEFKDEFYQRLQYANDRYTSSLAEGWETDRGRILIKYGLPTNIEPHLFDRGVAPHEIWVYNNIPGEGQAQFIFADRNGFGQFELIHSTVAGERRLANWQEELRRQ
ncbi:GWxTD domain-containing protein [Rhodocaloribacter litoris]|uniref:GWxTD domain-containing protein n=1 Tax=Rhodocaloribacter litoris TaxID=2558931 RepID=UPI001E2A84FB|nr:GWxTD domain-containing protein [Rhodocaloribacter litoris]QXD16375.1 GWxTD domain-containing protein [Rhodocaloribacter litoris]